MAAETVFSVFQLVSLERRERLQTQISGDPDGTDFWIIAQDMEPIYLIR